MNYGFNKYHQSNERHIALIFIAVLLSFAAHFCVMYFYGDIALGVSSEVVQKIRQTFENGRFPPMHVDSMPVDPLKILPRLKGEMQAPSRGPVDVSSRVDGLRQTPPPALTAPPPIPREALTPGVPALKEAVAEKVDTTPWVPRQEIKQIYDRIVQDDTATLPRREIPMIERIAKAPDMVPSIDLAGRSFGKDPEPPKAFESAEIFSDQMTRGSVTIPLPRTPVNENESLATAATAEKFAIKKDERSGKVRAGSEISDRAATAATEKAFADANKKSGAGKGQEQRGKVATETKKDVLTPVEKRSKEVQRQIAEIQENIEYVPIDDLLDIRLDSYRDRGDPSKIYFQIQIQTNTKKAVPSVPKDIVFVQDVSGSMGFRGNDGMQSFRRALSNAIKTLNTGDRFNIVTFRESFAYCFPDSWAYPTPENYRKAEEFIKGIHAYGNTDLFGSMKALAHLPRDPRRPMIAFVITDGIATSGLVRNAAIISEFSQLNSGMMSVYMFGTRSNANRYLLDMLTYCNRGNYSILRGMNSWTIPDRMQEEVEKIRNPLMGDISVVFDTTSAAEVYPQDTPNLYRDRPLVLSGVCPGATKELVFQVRGLAAAKGYDSVFRLPIQQARRGTEALKQRWAEQKMYHLAGEYSRCESPVLMTKMRQLHSRFSIQIPYAKKLK